MRLLKLFSFIFIFQQFCSSTFAADEISHVLKLQDAVNLAVDRNPAVLQAKEKLNEASAVSTLALAKSLPVVNGTLQANRQKDSLNSSRPRFDGDSYNFYTGQLEFSQTLLQRGYLSTIFAGGVEKPIREFDLQTSKRDLTFQVIQSFYKVLLDTHNIITLRKAQSVYKQSLDTAEHRLKIGRGQRLDALQARTQLALIAPKIEKTESDLKISGAELANLLGDREARSVEINGRLEPPNLKEIKSKLESSLSKVLELERMKLSLQQAENVQVATLGKHWPQLKAVGDIGRTGFKKGDLTDDDSTAWSVGLQISVPIFSGFSYFFEKNQLSSQLLQLRLEEQKLKDQIALSQVKSNQDLNSAESVIQSSKIAYDLAEESVKEAKSQYRVANIDYTQLLSTEQNLLESELSYDQAKYDYIRSLTNYFAAWGYDPEILVESLGGAS
jgi:outer membrane protein